MLLAVHGGYLPSEFPLSRRIISGIRNKPPPLSITTKVNDVDIRCVRDLYSACNHSCYRRFPNLDPDGRVDPVDLNKLRKALLHSSVFVAVFSQPEIFSHLSGIGGDLVRILSPVTPSNGKLVGLGRAVSDSALTASIYDVMVIPSLRRRGIGKRIVQMIIRMLTRKGIYDIAALCSNAEMPFLRACGFEDDILGSTTMMYTVSPNCCLHEDRSDRSVG